MNIYLGVEYLIKKASDKGAYSLALGLLELSIPYAEGNKRFFSNFLRKIIISKLESNPDIDMILSKEEYESFAEELFELKLKNLEAIRMLTHPDDEKEIVDMINQLRREGPTLPCVGL